MKIVKGSDATLNIKLNDKETGEPYDLTGLTGCTGYFPGEDDVTVSASGSISGAPELGRITIELSDENTDGLAAGDGKSFEIVIDQGTTRRVVQFDSALDVAERLF